METTVEFDLDVPERRICDPEGDCCARYLPRGDGTIQWLKSTTTQSANVIMASGVVKLELNVTTHQRLRFLLQVVCSVAKGTGT